MNNTTDDGARGIPSNASDDILSHGILPHDILSHDIITHMIALIPLGDHASISALASACRAYARLFSEWLRINEITDVRAGLSDDINICSGLHGTIRTVTTTYQRFLLDSGLRAYVERKGEFDQLQCVHGSYQFRFGRLVKWWNIRSNCELKTIAGYDVVVIRIITDEKIHLRFRARQSREPPDAFGAVCVSSISSLPYVCRINQNSTTAWYTEDERDAIDLILADASVWSLVSTTSI
jgi:hypothetical protein